MKTKTMHQSLPFEVGQLAEAKSFKIGFRGAWFRCKIHRTMKRKGKILYALEYYDYPDEKIEWIDIYQKPPKGSISTNEVKKELILRPHYPPIHHVNELPDLNTISEVIVAVDGVWRVGDLVDWLSRDCFWSGTITEVLSKDKVKVKFPDPPLGEGSVECANSNELRPSLDWSPVLGWTVSRLPGSQNDHLSARLIKPLDQGPIPRSLTVAYVDTQSNKAEPGSLELDGSVSSHTSASSQFMNSSVQPDNLPKQSEALPMKDMQQQSQPQPTDTASRTGCSGIGSFELPRENVFQNKQLTNDTSRENSTFNDNIEGAIMDLEELICKVKWLRQVLKSGLSSDTEGPTWKFLQQAAVWKPT